MTRASALLVQIALWGSLSLGACMPESGVDKMRLIPEGAFALGEHGETHEVYLEAFHIDQYEVTNAEYRQFVDAAGYSPLPAHWSGGTHAPDLADHPVVHVDFRDARAYCAWAGKRLPTEAEWEKAARGHDGREYAWGNVLDRSLGNVGGRGTAPVGSFAQGQSPYGVYDMTGNVWEWTSTLLKPYPYDATDGREDPAATGYRVLRGGAFTVTGYLARAARRGDAHPIEKDHSIGIRCAKDAG